MGFPLFVKEKKCIYSAIIKKCKNMLIKIWINIYYILAKNKLFHEYEKRDKLDTAHGMTFHAQKKLLRNFQDHNHW
jgi:hypothetical protein